MEALRQWFTEEHNVGFDEALAYVAYGRVVTVDHICTNTKGTKRDENVREWTYSSHTSNLTWVMLFLALDATC